MPERLSLGEYEFRYADLAGRYEVDAHFAGDVWVEYESFRLGPDWFFVSAVSQTSGSGGGSYRDSELRDQVAHVSIFTDVKCIWARKRAERSEL